MMTWEQYMDISLPTEKQVMAYCKKHGLDYNKVYGEDGLNTLSQILNNIANANVKKHFNRKG